MRLKPAVKLFHLTETLDGYIGVILGSGGLLNPSVSEGNLIATRILAHLSLGLPCGLIPNFVGWSHGQYTYGRRAFIEGRLLGSISIGLSLSLMRMGCPLGRRRGQRRR